MEYNFIRLGTKLEILSSPENILQMRWLFFPNSCFCYYVPVISQEGLKARNNFKKRVLLYPRTVNPAGCGFLHWQLQPPYYIRNSKLWHLLFQNKISISFSCTPWSAKCLLRNPHPPTFRPFCDAVSLAKQMDIQIMLYQKKVGR